MSKRKQPRSLANLFKSDYYENYKRMIREINPMLTKPIENFRQVDRLEFREDLPRGSHTFIYQTIAELLQSGRKGQSVMERRYSQDDLFWWFTEGGHSNLGVNCNILKHLVYKYFT